MKSHPIQKFTVPQEFAVIIGLTLRASNDIRDLLDRHRLTFAKKVFQYAPSLFIHRFLSPLVLKLCFKRLILLNKLRFLGLDCRHRLRMLFVKLDLIRRRLLISMNFFMHREEAAFYFRVRGRSIDKPNYVFKVFDKFHDTLWPNNVLYCIPPSTFISVRLLMLTSVRLFGGGVKNVLS